MRLVFCGAAILTLIATLYVEENMRGAILWNHYQKTAEARGVKLTISDHVPPAVPDNLNFAAIPIFQNTFKPSPPPDPFALPRKEGAKTPSLIGSVAGEPQPIDLAAWQKYFVDLKILPAASENPAADVLKVLDRYSPQLDQLRLAGLRPECRFPVRYQDGASAALPHMGLLQSAARLYVLRLSAHLALGQQSAAYDDFAGCLRLYTAMVHEPTLIAGLVRLSEIGMLHGAVWGGLVRHQWTATELEKIEAGLSGIRLFDDYVLAMGSERGFTNFLHEEFLRMNQQKRTDMLRSLGNPGAPLESVKLQGWGLTFYPGGWLRLSQVRSNDYFDQALAAVSQTPPRVDRDRFAVDLPALKDKAGPVERLQYAFFFLTVTVFDPVLRNYAYGQTLLDQTRLGCAIERYRFTLQQLPASLEALAPDFIAAIPHDVMTGGPLHYQSNPNGSYILYSVGWNRQDEGGKIDPSLSSPKQQLDWVWKMPAWDREK